MGSGTSADAIDLALVEVIGKGRNRRANFLAGGMLPLAPALQSQVRSLPTASVVEIAQAQFDFGQAFGQAARRFLLDEGVAPESIFAAGSHGQTIFHHDGTPSCGSFQVGHPALVAQHIGTQVVGDFRWGDLAAGGQGAPISPFGDWTLHRKAAPHLAILNLGGIGNLTYLQGEAPPQAWDTGPANGPLDLLMRMETDAAMDKDGACAASGVVLPDLLAELQKNAFFHRPLPRSTGLERFGSDFVRQIRKTHPDARLENLMATLVELAVWAVVDTLQQAKWPGGTLYLCGGGARNPSLCSALERQLAGTPFRSEAVETQVASYADLGWNPDLREAVAFALLADAFLAGETASWPTTTGARVPAVLGSLSLPS